MTIPCSLCESQGQKPRYGENVRIVYDPALVMPGPPTIDGHRLSAKFVTHLADIHGVAYVVKHWEISRDKLLTACWWSGMYGTRKWRRLYGEWAREAGAHMWYRCYNFPDPPREEQT